MAKAGLRNRSCILPCQFGKLCNRVCLSDCLHPGSPPLNRRNQKYDCTDQNPNLSSRMFPFFHFFHVFHVISFLFSHQSLSSIPFSLIFSHFYVFSSSSTFMPDGFHFPLPSVSSFRQKFRLQVPFQPLRKLLQARSRTIHG